MAGRKPKPTALEDPEGKKNADIRKKIMNSIDIEEGSMAGLLHLWWNAACRFS